MKLAEARHILAVRAADQAAEQRALARINAPHTRCIHDLMLASCSLCMGQDPFTVDTNANGDHVMVPVNEVESSKHSGRGYENKPGSRLLYDNAAWVLQHAQRQGLR